jgi:hypothetical protein
LGERGGTNSRKTSKRNLGHQVYPFIRTIVRPDEDQRLRNVPNGRLLRDDQQNTGAIATRRDERRQAPRHRALIVADENPALLGCAPQYQFVVQIVQSGYLSCLEIDAALAT